jgi:hypothetical protein
VEMRKKIFVGIIHILVIAHSIWILSKDNPNSVEGILFVSYVLIGALYWKKIAKEQKKKYE